MDERGRTNQLVRRHAGCRWGVGVVLLAGLVACTCDGSAAWAVGGMEALASPTGRSAAPLARAKVYLAAGDYRRALAACQQEVDERPSAASYTFITYIYHALDGYLEHLSAQEEWGAVEGLYWNLAYRDAQDLVDPPGGLARMAKEMIQHSVRYQADRHAAMAHRLDSGETDRLWVQQTTWRAAAPDRWWAGVPDDWRW